MLVLPTGYKLNQLKSEQPTETYGRSQGDSPRDQPLPGRAARDRDQQQRKPQLRQRTPDHQLYYRFVHVERCWLNCNVLDLVFKHWLEALFIPGILPRWRSPTTSSTSRTAGTTTPNRTSTLKRKPRGLITPVGKRPGYRRRLLPRDARAAIRSRYAILARQKEAREKLGLPFPARSCKSRKKWPRPTVKDN